METNLRKRLQCIVNGLNAILLAYNGKTLGDLSHTPCPKDLIFVVNKCKTPTGVDGLTAAGTTLQTLSNFSRQPTQKTLEQWTKTFETEAWKLRNPTCDLPWEDIWNCWDVTCSEPLTLVEFPSFTASASPRQGQQSSG